MSINHSDLINQLAISVANKYAVAKNYPENTPSHNDLVRYGVFLISLTETLLNTPDGIDYRANQIELIIILDSVFSELCLKNNNLGFQIAQLAYEIKDYVTSYMRLFSTANLATLEIEHFRITMDPWIYHSLPIGVNPNRMKFMDMLFNLALTKVTRRKNIATIKKDLDRLSVYIRREMQQILDNCSRENNRKLNPRYIGALGTTSSFTRAMSVTFFYYEQHNPSVPILLILYLFAVFPYGDTVSKILTGFKTNQRHSASTVFSTTTIAAVIISAFVIQLRGALGQRIAWEFGFYFGLPIAHFILLHTPVYRLIEKLYNGESYFFPRWYESDFRRNLSDTGRVVGAYQVAIYVLVANGVLACTGVDVTQNLPLFFIIQISLAILTQIFYFAYYYFSLTKYAKEAEENMLLTKIRWFATLSIERNQSLKDLQSENIWMVVFSNLFLRATIMLDQAFTNNVAKLMTRICGFFLCVFASRLIGTLLQREMFGRQAPASINQQYLTYLKDNNTRIGLNRNSVGRIDGLLARKKSKPQKLNERVQQVMISGQNGKMQIGFGDHNVVFGSLLLQYLTVINYYVIEIMLYNALVDTKDKPGTISYFFIEFAINIALILITMLSLLLILNLSKAALFIVEIYGSPSRFIRATKTFCTTLDLTKTGQAFKKNTFVQNYPAYHADLSTRMRTIMINADVAQALMPAQVPAQSLLPLPLLPPPPPYPNDRIAFSFV